MRRLALGALVALALLSGPSARAGSADCGESSLGERCRAAELIGLASLAPAGEQVRVTPVRWLRGERAGALLAQGEVQASGEARALVFLAREEGAWRLLEALPLANPEQARRLCAAVEARLSGGELFGQLLSPLPRVRRDAALDLLERAELRAGRAQRELVARALRELPSLELLELSARLASPELFAPLRELLTQISHPVPQAAAARALVACDRARALALFEQGLRRDPVEQARLLGFVGGAEAGERLSRALAAAEQPLARQAILLALYDARRCQASALAELAKAPRAPGEERLALAVLARCGEGRTLRALQGALPDPAARDLARALRRDPVVLPRRLLAPALDALYARAAAK